MNDYVDTLRFVPRWYVMFNGPRERRFFVDRFTSEGFRHCLAYGFDAGGERWLIYDVTRIGTAVLSLTSEELGAWLTAHREAGARVLRVDLPEKVRQRSWLQTGMWCVTAVVHLVGVRSSAWRPIALWRDLVKAGAVEEFVDDGLAEVHPRPVSPRDGADHRSVAGLP